MTKDPLDIDWAYIVDLLASEYGWKIDYISTLDLGTIKSLCTAIRNRYSKQNGDNNSDVDTSENNNTSDYEFEQDMYKMGGKKHIREDGTVEIIV